MWFDIPWQIWILFSGVLSALGQSIGKRLVDKYSAFQVGFWRDVGSIVFAGSLFLYLGYSSNSYSLLIFVYGFLLSLSLAAYLSANREDFSGSSVFSYSISQLLIVISSAFMFSEWVYFDPRSTQGMVNIIAVVLTLVSFYMYQSESGRTQRWNKMIALSVLVNVVGNLFVKYAIDDGIEPFNFLTFQYLGLVAGGLFFLIGRGKKILIESKDILSGMFQGFLIAFGVSIYIYVLKDNPLSLAVTVRRVATVLLTALSGLYLFEEKKGMGKRAVYAMALGFLVFILVMFVN